MYLAIRRADQFPLDPAVSTPGIVPGQAHNEVSHLGTDPRTSRRVRIGPVSTDQAPVPGQERGRGDDPMLPQLARQGTDQAAELLVLRQNRRASAAATS